MNDLYSHKLFIVYREDIQQSTYIYTNLHVHVQEQNIFPNQERAETFTVITLINLHNFSSTTIL